jgi:hypothetical protein
MWNYGDVLITVGGSQLIFEDLMDPASVQQDLDRRRLARVEQKKQMEVAAERERMADYFASYHNSAEDLRREQEAQKTAKANGDKVQ